MASNGTSGGEPIFIIEDLHASIEGKEILRGVDLTINRGEVHALMGPNGSGKSTLANTIMGHPNYKVTKGRIRFNGQDIAAMSVDERARRGLFLAFQYPIAIPGVVYGNFLRNSLKARRQEDVPVREFRKLLDETLDLLKMDHEFVRRYVNDGFSGGEKKRAEVLQMALLRPEMAVLDETDSGLDIDALRTVAEGINALRGPELGMLLITHYQRLLNYIKPDIVHVLYQGRIIKTGGAELALELERDGYDKIIAEFAPVPAGAAGGK